MPLIKVPHWKADLTKSHWGSVQSGLMLKPVLRHKLLSFRQVKELLMCSEFSLEGALEKQLWVFWFHGSVYTDFEDAFKCTVFGGKQLPENAQFIDGEWGEFWLHPVEVFRQAALPWNRFIKREIKR